MAMFLARMVMPRSRSRGLESRMQSPWSWLARNWPGLAEQGIDQGGLAVVDVGDDGDVADVVAALYVGPIQVSLGIGWAPGAQDDRRSPVGREILGRGPAVARSVGCGCRFLGTEPRSGGGGLRAGGTIFDRGSVPYLD